MERLPIKSNKIHKLYIFSQFCSTYMFRSCLTIIRVRCYGVSNTAMCALLQGVIVCKCVIHNPNIVWYVNN
jgi:hypothetical protein